VIFVHRKAQHTSDVKNLSLIAFGFLCVTLAAFGYLAIAADSRDWQMALAKLR
jgi:hypothetical protein